MSINQEVRPRYFEGQYLGADDLTVGVVWALGRDERHVLGAHTWGIATGLQLQEVPSPGGTGVDIYVRHGYGWGGFGRPLVVLAPYQIPTDLFQSFTSTSSANPSLLIKVWLQYDESETLPAQPGFAPCSSDDTSSRVMETFRLVVGAYNSNASQRDPVSVAGRLIDASLAFQSFVATDGLLNDASVPFQALPDEGATAKWLIPLGFVRWQPNAVLGQPGNFVTSSDDDKTVSRAARTYIGTVAESLLAADGILRLADRTRDYRTAKFKDKDLVHVEGVLRAEGNLRLWGTQIDFRDPSGDDEGTPFVLQRTDDPAAGVKMLDVQIGTATAGVARFGVGPLNAAGTAIDEKFVVLDSGNVGIGTVKPITALQIPERGLQVGISSTATDNFHAVSDTNTGPRGFRLYNQNFGSGVHLVTFLPSGNVGIGTTNPLTALQIPERGLQIGVSGTASDNFHFVSDLNQARGLRLYNGNYGAGIHLLTVLPSGQVGIGFTATNPALQLDIQGDFGRTNGPATLHLWGSTVGDVGNGVLFLRSGGNVVAVDKPGQRFGIGTSAPSSSLEVDGNTQLVGDLNVTGTARKPGGGPWTAPSDLALKKNVQPLTEALDKLLGLRGISFEWKDPSRMGGLTGTQTGLIAQEVEAVFPQWISTAPDGTKEMTIRGFEALAVESCRNLQDQIHALQKRVAELEKQAKEQGHATGKPRGDTGRRKPTA